MCSDSHRHPVFWVQEVVRLMEHKERGLPAGEVGNRQRRVLLQAQGDVLLHIDMAVKHDAELGQAWLRQLRMPDAGFGSGGSAAAGLGMLLSPFSLATSFMLAGVQRFEQPVTDALKALVVGAYRDAATRSGAGWLPSAQQGGSAAGGAGAQAEGPAGSNDALRAALLQCVRNSAHGQGGLVQPMVGLAMVLMEAGAARGAAAWYRGDGSLNAELAPPAAKVFAG